MKSWNIIGWLFLAALLAAVIGLIYVFREKISDWITVVFKTAKVPSYVGGAQAAVGLDSAGRTPAHTPSCVIIPGLPAQLGCGEVFTPKS